MGQADMTAKWKEQLEADADRPQSMNWHLRPFSACRTIAPSAGTRQRAGAFGTENMSEWSVQ
jgi:hypothetical protein